MIDNDQLEDFIEGWHWDENSHKFAKEMGQFIFEFLDHLKTKGISEKTIRKHENNCWLIAKFEADYGYQDEFSPEIFITDPHYLTEFKRKVSNSKYSIDSYKSTWRKLAKYATSVM